MNPYHDDEGKFTSAGDARTQTGATPPRTSPEHSQRHQATVAAGSDPRDAPRNAGPARKATADMTPAEARAYLERTAPRRQPDPPIIHEVIDVIRHPFTPKTHQPNGAPRQSRAPYEGEPPEPTPEEPAATKGATKKSRTPPLKPDELQKLREASPDGAVTNEDIARRDSGLSPYHRAPGPRLLTGGGSAPTLDELHAQLGTGLAQEITRRADKTGSGNYSGTWPGVPHHSNPFARKSADRPQRKGAR